MRDMLLWHGGFPYLWPFGGICDGAQAHWSGSRWTGRTGWQKRAIGEFRGCCPGCMNGFARP